MASFGLFWEDGNLQDSDHGSEKEELIAESPTGAHGKGRGLVLDLRKNRVPKGSRLSKNMIRGMQVPTIRDEKEEARTWMTP